jgi:trehalose synthase
MELVQIPTLSFDRFGPIIGRTAADRLRSTVADAREILDGRIVWHVNSTRTGGGVAEMLQTLLGYERGAGLDARWMVIDGDPEFFALTKRIHHSLHGRNGDGLRYSERDRDHYRAVAHHNTKQVLRHVRPNDVVVLHDPQTAGLAPALRQAGAVVVWRCHIGCDRPNHVVHDAWQFLQPHLDDAHGFVFTRPGYVPPWARDAQTFIIPPAVDAFSAKNAPMARSVVRGVLGHIGLLRRGSYPGEMVFIRTDGSTGRVERRAKIHQTAPIPGWNVPMVVQVSRWDPLKDMLGVMHAFAQSDHLGDAHLALVGPDVSGVSDDPEGAGVLEECIEEWYALPPAARERVHLVTLPMDDIEENAVMVNAIQRHATVVIQKSLQEGFGLTVTEAMWKGRPIIASAVGGIQDQIVDGVHGLLLQDPTDPRGLGHRLERLLKDPQLARRLGRNARRRAINHFLGPRHMTRFVDLLYAVEGRTRRSRAA